MANVPKQIADANHYGKVKLVDELTDKNKTLGADGGAAVAPNVVNELKNDLTPVRITPHVTGAKTSTLHVYKIGQLVHIDAYIETGSTTITISGLPQATEIQYITLQGQNVADVIGWVDTNGTISRPVQENKIFSINATYISK